MSEGRVEGEHKVQSTQSGKWPLSAVHSIMTVKSAQPGEGGGVHALPLSLYLPSRAKLWCTLQLRGQIYTPPISPLPLFVLCGREGGKG